MSALDIDLTIGALEVSVFITAILLGIATLQAFTYLRRFTQDPVWIKLMVVTVYVLDVVHSCLLLHTLYFYTVSNFGSAAPLTTSTWSLNVCFILQWLVALIVQTFFCYRIYRLSRSFFLSLFCWLVNVARLASVALVIARAFMFWNFMYIETVYRSELLLCLALIGAADTIVALTLVGTLLRIKTAYMSVATSGSDRMIRRITIFFIGSGLCTSLVALAEIITFVSMGLNFVWIAFSMVLVKLYSNSMLASLNTRDYLRCASETPAPFPGHTMHPIEFADFDDVDPEVANVSKISGMTWGAYLDGRDGPPTVTLTQAGETLTLPMHLRPTIDEILQRSRPN